MFLFTILFALAVEALGDGIGIGNPLIGGIGYGGIGLNRGVLVGNSLGLGAPAIGLGWGIPTISHGLGASGVGLGLGGLGLGKGALVGPTLVAPSSLGISNIGLNRGVLIGNGLGIGGIGLAGKGLSWGAGPIGVSSWGQGGIRHRRDAPAQEAAPQEADHEADSEPAASGIGSIGGISGISGIGAYGLQSAGLIGVPAIGVQQSVWGPSSLASRALVAPSWGSAGIVGAKGIGGLGGVGWARPWGLGSGVGLSSGWGLGAVNAVPVAVGVRPVAVAVPVSVPVVSQQIIGLGSPSVLGAIGSPSLIGGGKHGY